MLSSLRHVDQQINCILLKLRAALIIPCKPFRKPDTAGCLNLFLYEPIVSCLNNCVNCFLAFSCHVYSGIKLQGGFSKIPSSPPELIAGKSKKKQEALPMMSVLPACQTFNFKFFSAVSLLFSADLSSCASWPLSRTQSGQACDVTACTQT